MTDSDRDQFGELAHAIVRWLEKYPDVGDITRENYVAGKLASVARLARQRDEDWRVKLCRVLYGNKKVNAAIKATPRDS